MSFYEDFGLTESRVQPVLEAAIGADIARFTLVAADAIKAGATDADKRICTFRCVTARGKGRDIRIFVKRCVWQNVRESIHYQYLQSHGVPTATLYGALENDLGQEIIFLEVIPTVRFDEENLAQCRSMLSLLAQFNACSIAPAYVAHLWPYSQIGQIGRGCWVSGYSARLNEDELSGELHRHGVSEAEVPALIGAARSLYAEIDAQPRGLLHQDFSLDNFGWRENTGLSEGEPTAVVFDLHKNGQGPRFSDVATYLSEVEWCDRTAAFLGRTSTEEHGATTLRILLTDHYLAEYARFSGMHVPRETFVREVDAICWAHKIGALPVIVERGDIDGVERVAGFLRNLAEGNTATNR